MDLFRRAKERHEDSKLYLRMSKDFASGRLRLGTPGEPPDDGKELAEKYRRWAVQARRSAMLIRRIALGHAAGR